MTCRRRSRWGRVRVSRETQAGLAELPLARLPDKFVVLLGQCERFRDLRMEEVARLLRSAAAIPHLLTFCIISLNTLARPDAVLDLSPAGR